MSIIIGAVIAAAWGGLLLWAVWRIGWMAAKGHSLEPASYVTGIIGAALLTAGLLLIFRGSLPDDVIGTGVLLAGAGTLALWGVGRSIMPERTNVFLDDPIFTEEGDVRPVGKATGQPDGAAQ